MRRQRRPTSLWISPPQSRRRRTMTTCRPGRARNIRAMTTKNPEAPPVEGALVMRYETTLGAIAQLGEQFKGLSFDTPEDYERGRKAIAVLRDKRVAVEKRRKELKADSLAFGRKVDAAAAELTSAIEAIEE